MADLAESAARHWNRLLAPYMKADAKRAVFQLSSTAALYALTWGLMLYLLDKSLLLTFLLAVPAALFLIRLFIFQHDCGHGSFFSSRRANDTVGFLIGVLMLTPYEYWKKTHGIHHATAGDLDRRAFGDIETLTVKEYLALTKWGRTKYRIYRHPISFLVIGPLYQFVVKHRLPLDAPRAWKREWTSVLFTNLAIAMVLFAAWETIGLGRFLIVQLPITLLAGSLGIWLFYIQHQFEDTYWRDHPEWDFHRAGIEGSSFYDLPAVLHWCTGNIGFHHVHHLASKIPNYRLKKCFREVQDLHCVTRLGMVESLRCARLRLWDEESGRLIGFRDLRLAGAAA